MKHKIFSYELLNELPNIEVETWDKSVHIYSCYLFNCILTRPVTHVETKNCYLTCKLSIKVCEKERLFKL